MIRRGSRATHRASHSFRAAVGLFPEELAVDGIGEIHERVPVKYRLRDRGHLVGSVFRTRNPTEVGVALDVLPRLLERLESTSEPEFIADPGIVRDCNSLVARCAEHFLNSKEAVFETLVRRVGAVFGWVRAGEQ